MSKKSVRLHRISVQAGPGSETTAERKEWVVHERADAGVDEGTGEHGDARECVDQGERGSARTHSQATSGVEEPDQRTRTDDGGVHRTSPSHSLPVLSPIERPRGSATTHDRRGYKWGQPSS